MTKRLSFHFTSLFPNAGQEPGHSVAILIFAALEERRCPPRPPGFIWKNGEAGGIFTALQPDFPS